MSLFTCIVVDETYNIITSKAFSNSEIFCDYSKTYSNVSLTFFAWGNTFIFNDKLYKRTDGAPMGGCVSPTLAEIFMSHNETLWLNNCPSKIKPLLYRR